MFTRFTYCNRKGRTHSINRSTAQQLIHTHSTKTTTPILFNDFVPSILSNNRLYEPYGNQYQAHLCVRCMLAKSNSSLHRSECKQSGKTRGKIIKTDKERTESKMQLEYSSAPAYAHRIYYKSPYSFWLPAITS